MGQLRRAVSCARQALAISSEINSAHGRGFNSCVLTLRLLDCGLLDEPYGIIEAMQDADWADDGPHQIMVQLNKSLVCRAFCDVSAAPSLDQNLLKALEENDGETLLALDQVVVQFLVEDYALLGQWDAAVQHAPDAPLPEPSVWLFLAAQFRWWLLIEALLRGKNSSRAQELLDHLETFAATFPRLRPAYARSRAVLARRRGDYAQATEHLKTALSLARNMDLTNEIWSIQGALAYIAREWGNDQMAKANRQAARQTIDRLAANIDEPALRETFVSGATRLLDKPLK